MASLRGLRTQAATATIAYPFDNSALDVGVPALPSGLSTADGMALMATRATSMGRLRAVGLLGVAAVVMACATECGKAGTRFKEGAALSDCGQQLGIGGVSYPVNFTPGGIVEPDGIVELVANCKVGVQVAINGPDFKVVGAIHTEDGAYQAVAIEFQGTTGPNGTLTVSQHGHRLGQMRLLTRYAQPGSGQPSFCDHLAHNCGS